MTKEKDGWKKAESFDDVRDHITKAFEKKPKNKSKKEVVEYEFDLDGKEESKRDFKAEILELEKKVFTLEKIIRQNGFQDELPNVISDEEYICLKGMETIKKLVLNEIQTKDDINMFDVLYRNLCIIRGIKVPKKEKEKPKTKEELYSVIKGGKV